MTITDGFVVCFAKRTLVCFVTNALNHHVGTPKGGGTILRGERSKDFAAPVDPFLVPALGFCQQDVLDLVFLDYRFPMCFSKFVEAR